MVEAVELVAYPVYAGGVTVEHLRSAEPCLHAVRVSSVVVCQKAFARKRAQLHGSIQVGGHKQIAIGRHTEHIDAAARQSKKVVTSVTGTELPQSMLLCSYENVASLCYGNSAGADPDCLVVSSGSIHIIRPS